MPHLPNHEEFAGVGADKADKDVTNAYDKQYGTYLDKVNEVSVDDRLPTANMPKAPDPSPFTLGSLGR